MWHAVGEGKCESEWGRGLSFLLPICYGTSTFPVNSMAFAFAKIGTGTDSFTAFTFIFPFTPTFAPQYIYMLFDYFIAFTFAFACRMPHIASKEF